MATMKKRVPKFSTQEEEIAFWEENSPDEYFDEKDFKPLEVRVPLDRPITIRLDTRLKKVLEDYAAAHSLGPSTAARRLIEEGLARFETHKTADSTWDDLMATVLRQIPAGHRDEMEQVLKEGAIGDPQDPALIVLDPRKLESVSKRFFVYLLAALRAEVIEPGDEAYEAVKSRAAKLNEKAK